MTKPNLKEIEWAIYNLENEESSESRYILLAALYTCRDHLRGVEPEKPAIEARVEKTYPIAERIDRYGDSEFLQAVEGKDNFLVMEIMDELMDTLHAVNAKVYHSVISKLQNLENNEPPL